MESKQKKSKKTKIKNHEIAILEPEDWLALQKQKELPNNNRPIINVFNFPAKRLEHRYKVRYKHNKKHLFFDILMFFALIALIVFNAYFIFFGKGLESDQLALSVDIGDGNIKSGSIVEIYIRYSNNNSEEIKNAVLGVNLPSGFTLLDSSKPLVKDNTFDIGNLSAGGSNEISLRGQMIGQVGKSYEVNALISYDKSLSFQNLITRFRTYSSGSFNLVDSVLSIESTLSNQLIADQDTDFKLIIKNNGEFVIDNISIEPQSSDAWVVTDFGDSYNGKKGLWFIDSLAAGQEFVINVSAKFDSENTKANEVIDYILKISYKNHELLQAIDNYNITIITPKIETELALLNQKHIQPGQKSKFEFTFTNNENVDIHDLKVILDLPPKFFDLSTLKTNGIYNGNQIIWDSSSIPSLVLTESAKSNSILFDIGVRDDIKPENFGTSKRNITIPISGTLQYVMAGSSQVITIPIPKFQAKLGTSLSMNAFARYYSVEGEQIGRGPLPPIVDELTKYWIFFKVKNTSNKIRNVKIHGILAQNVSLTSQSISLLGDKISFSKVDSGMAFTIDIGDIDVFAGTLRDAFSINYEIAFTPARHQLDTFASLITDIWVEAVDDFTNSKLSYRVTDINTQLLLDKKAASKGGRIIVWE